MTKWLELATRSFHWKADLFFNFLNAKFDDKKWCEIRVV